MYYAISDFGLPVTRKCQSLPCVNMDDCIYEELQYGVWIVDNDVPVEVVEASNDFEYLKQKYNVKYLIIISSYENQ
jgi:hypothetical protein